MRSEYHLSEPNAYVQKYSLLRVGKGNKKSLPKQANQSARVRKPSIIPLRHLAFQSSLRNSHSYPFGRDRWP